MGVVSKRWGGPSSGRIALSVLERFVAMVRDHYPDFGPTLSCEYLTSQHGYAGSAEKLRGWTRSRLACLLCWYSWPSAGPVKRPSQHLHNHDPEDPGPTQFERASAQFNVESILASSQHSKGRVERVFQTLQDGLVEALRVAAVSTIEAANARLPQYLTKHNARHGYPACDSAHAPVPLTVTPGIRAALAPITKNGCCPRR